VQCETVESALATFLGPDEGDEKDDLASIVQKFKGVHSGESEHELDDADEQIRIIIVREALAVMSASRFILSKTYLPHLPEPPKWRRPYLKSSRASPFDTYLHYRLGGGVKTEPAEQVVQHESILSVSGNSLAKMLLSDLWKETTREANGGDIDQWCGLNALPLDHAKSAWVLAPETGVASTRTTDKKKSKVRSKRAEPHSKKATKGRKT